MLKNQTVNHVSEHLSAICPVYTNGEGSPGWHFSLPACVEDLPAGNK